MWMQDIYWSIEVVVCFFVTAVILLLSSGLMPSFKRFKAIQKLPGPKGFWLIGNTLELINRPIEDHLLWLKEKMQDHKRLMRVWFLAVSNVYLVDPDDVQTVFNSTLYIDKGLLYDTFKPWLGEGLLTSTGEKWHARRKLLTPAFHFKILEDNMTTFNKCSKVLCQKLKETGGKEVDIEAFTTLCTLDIIMGTSMGVNLESQTDGNCQYVYQLKKVTEWITERMMRPHLFLDWVFNLSSTGKKFYNSVSYLHNYSYNVIKERRALNTSNGSQMLSKKRRAFLDTLLDYEEKNPGLFNDDDIREEVDTFMFEGHDTTSVALVYIFYNLSTNLDIQQKVYKELEEIFGSSERDITVEDLSKMVYLEKVIKESLRLYPSVPAVSRLLDKDVILNDGLVIPAQANVITPIYLVHRNEKHWEDPEKFDPERFSEEQSLKRHPYAYIPFSAGPRNCIGQKFAMMELKTVVSSVIRQFKVEPSSDGEDFKVVIHLVLRANKQIKCKFTSRKLN